MSNRKPLNYKKAKKLYLSIKYLFFSSHGNLILLGLFIIGVNTSIEYFKYLSNLNTHLNMNLEYNMSFIEYYNSFWGYVSIFVIVGITLYISFIKNSTGFLIED